MCVGGGGVTRACARIACKSPKDNKHRHTQTHTERHRETEAESETETETETDTQTHKAQQVCVDTQRKFWVRKYMMCDKHVCHVFV